MDKYQALREALSREDGRWVTVAYGPKTMGVGISGGPALFLARPGSGTDIEDVSQIVSDLCSIRNDAAALLAERDALRSALTILTGQMDAPECRSGESDSCYGAEQEAFKQAYAALAI